MSEDIQKEPFPPSRPGPDQGPRDARDLDYRDQPCYPPTVMAAGVLWILFGSLILLYTVGASLLYLVVPNMASGAVPYEIYYFEFSWLGGGALLSAAAFLFVGVQSVRGTSRDILGRGIGSIIFSLIYFFGVQMLGIRLFGNLSLWILGGLLLMTAGVLAIVGRSDYKRWRMAQKTRKDQDALANDAARQFRT